MKISNIKLQLLRNEEHFQFHTETLSLIEGSNPQVLGIDGLLPAYKANHADEAEALDVIRKSAVTDDLSKADMLRDTTLMGMKAALKSAGNHFPVSYTHLDVYKRQQLHKTHQCIGVAVTQIILIIHNLLHGFSLSLIHI